GGARRAHRRDSRPQRQGHRDHDPRARPCLPRARSDARGRSVTAPLWLLTLITFSGTLAMHIFVPALPEAARALDASIGEMQLTMSVYILGLAVGQLAYGPLSDRYGRRPLLVAGLALYTVAGLAACFVGDV